MRYIHLAFLSVLSLASLTANAQNHDHVWLFGAGNEAPPLSDTRMDFNVDPPQITIDPKSMIMFRNCTVTSDAEGKLLFYSNGKFISNANHQTMANGTGLNPGDHASSSGASYVIGPQCIFSIPIPGDPDKYYVFMPLTNFSMIRSIL